MARGYLCVLTLACLIGVTFAFIDITVDKLPACISIFGKKRAYYIEIFTVMFQVRSEHYTNN